LYSFRPNASWPVDVVGHLQQCPKCQQLQTKLKQIDQGVDKMTSAAGSPVAVAQLLDRVAKTPQAGAPSSTGPSVPWRWLKAGAYLIGAAALIIFGWHLGRLGDDRNVPGDPIEKIKTVVEFRDRVQEKIIEVQSPADRVLFAKLLRHNAQLVQSAQVGDRLEALLDMADDCRQHAWTLIEQGPRDALPLTIDLYGQLLREGVLVQLAQAPADARPALQKTARARLTQMADLPVGQKALPGVLTEQREALQNATDEAIKLVDEPEKAPVKPKQTSQGESLSPAATLVRFAVTVSSETDPVVKADLCTHYVKRLLPTMNIYLSEDSVPQRAEMGQQFGEMIQFGVYRPLELATAKEPAPPVKAEAERIFQFAADAIASMEKSLEQAPQGSRLGWEKALEATKKSFEKSKGKGKGAPAGKGKDKTEKGPREIRGTLLRIDAGAGTVTLSVRSHGKESMSTYALTKEALKAMAGKSVGATLHLHLAEDRRTVIEIRPGGNDGERNQK
jgi:hypothetical protein